MKRAIIYGLSVALLLSLTACGKSQAEHHAEPDPAATSSQADEPITTPAPEPEQTSEPVIIPEPSLTPEPTTTPEPVTTPEPASTNTDE